MFSWRSGRRSTRSCRLLLRRSRIAGLPLLICVSVAFGVYAAAGFASVLAFVIGNGVMAGGQVQDFEGNPV